MKKEINYTIDSHTQYPKKPSKAYRKWDGKTLYAIHPIWCATTILTETTLEEKIRSEGYQVLLYHDILEDTISKLPETLETKVIWLINEMTFEGGSEEEMQKIWQKPKEIRLFKLYDKVSNILDGTWMDKYKKEIYAHYTQKLTEDVENNYGTLNIIKIARAIAGGEK